MKRKSAFNEKVSKAIQKRQKGAVSSIIRQASRVAPYAARGFYGINSGRGKDELKFVDTDTATTLAVAGSNIAINLVARRYD